MSAVFTSWRWLQEEIESLILPKALQDERSNIIDLVEQRFKEAVHPLCIIAYLGDPFQRLTRQTTIRAEDRIRIQDYLRIEAFPNDEPLQASIFSQLELLRLKTGVFSNSFDWQTAAPK